MPQSFGPQLLIITGVSPDVVVVVVVDVDVVAGVVDVVVLVVVLHVTFALVSFPLPFVKVMLIVNTQSLLLSIT